VEEFQLEDSKPHHRTWLIPAVSEPDRIDQSWESS
jgi:hypothetical protein